MRLNFMYNFFHVIYTWSLVFFGHNKLFYNQNDFWCYILWLLECIVFFHRRSCQPWVHRLVIVHYVVAKRNCNEGDRGIVGLPTPSSSLWSSLWLLMWSKNCWSSSSLKSSMFSSWNYIMGCSFWFDVCVCGCCGGDIKGDEEWFYWSKEVCWA